MHTEGQIQVTEDRATEVEYTCDDVSVKGHYRNSVLQFAVIGVKTEYDGKVNLMSIDKLENVVALSAIMARLVNDIRGNDGNNDN